MDLKRAEDIMIPLDEYPHIPYWFTLIQAVEEFEKYEIEVSGRRSLPRALMVFNEDYQLLGVVRRRDIFRGLEPDSLANLLAKSHKKDLDTAKSQDQKKYVMEKFKKTIQKRARRPVTDVMIRIPATIDAEEDLIKISSGMVNNDLSILPVMKEGVVVGVVRTVDVFSELAKHIDREEERPSNKDRKEAE